VDIVFRQLSSVIAIFFQDTREICHLIFQFADGFRQWMGHRTQKPVCIKKVRFDVAGQENIGDIRCLFENTSESTTPQKLIGIQASLFSIPCPIHF
jgi:hypothetical protein